MKHACAIVVLVSSFIIGACQAASPPQVPESLLACSRLPDPGARVRCYDKQVAAMKAAAGGSAVRHSSTVAAASSSAPAAPAPSSSAPGAARSGAKASAIPVVRQATPRAAVAGPAPSGAAGTAATAPQQPSAAQFGADSLPLKLQPKPSARNRVLLSRITGINELRPNVFIFALANGQVWLQEGTQRSQVALFFRTGDDVRIEKSTFGSYRLSANETGNKNWIYVRRVQ